MKRLSTIVIAVAALGAAGWWGYHSQRAAPRAALEITPGAAAKAPPAAGPSGAGPAASGGAPRQVVGVEVIPVEVMALTDDVSGVGTVSANESVVIKPEIAGRITRIAVGDGAQVAKGAVLIELDRSVLAAQAAQARAELALSRTSYDRTVDLAKRNFVSASARDQAQANLQVQQAKLQLAEAQLDKATIRAPFAGVLGLRKVSTGDYVREGNELIVLEDISTMKVDLRLPERYAGRVQKGQTMQLAVESLPGRTFVATVDALDAQIDAEGRALVARGRLTNPDRVLRSGMFVKSRVVLKEKPKALVVPEEAILPIGTESFVFRVEDGKARRIAVTTGIRRDGKVEIVSGLEPGATVVTAGQLRLTRDGMEVRVVAGNGGAAGGGANAGGTNAGSGPSSPTPAPTPAAGPSAPPAGGAGSAPAKRG